MAVGPGPASGRLTMADALIRWCDTSLVEAVRAEERRHTAIELALWPEPKLSSSDEWRQPTKNSWMAGGLPITGLSAMWRELVRDFRKRIEAGAIHLEGVEVTDGYDAEATGLRGVFAAEFKFNFSGNTLQLGKKRYTAITASRTPPAPKPIVPDSPASTAPTAREMIATAITPETVKDLSSETILALLEENAKRVIADPTAKLFPPGKLTVMPLIQGKMRHRAAQAELLTTLAAEAAWLHDWASSRVELHSVPGVPTIQKVLGKEYAVLKTRSKAATQ
jgi:hypothetical protein